MEEAESTAGPRRRARAGALRRRQIVVRFSDTELELVGETAALAGLAVGAWIGGTALEVARSGGLTVGLPDLLRLHADVLVIQRATDRAGVGRAELLALVQRLDAAVDAVVADVGRSRS